MLAHVRYHAIALLAYGLSGAPDTVEMRFMYMHARGHCRMQLASPTCG